MELSLKCYQMTLEFHYTDKDNIYFHCRGKRTSTHIVSALPICFSLPNDKCRNLDLLRKGVEIRRFWYPFTRQGKYSWESC